MIKPIAIVLFSGLLAGANADVSQCGGADSSIVDLTICLDDEVRDLETLLLRVQSNVYARIETKYRTRDASRADLLKRKLNNSVLVWSKYRSSYCDLESISVSDSDDQAEFVKQCVLSVTRSRIEDLRLLQINI